jgi:clan AA aspartic protease
MGQFKVKIGVVHPADPGRSAEVELLVDTGATLSWVPREVLERIGAPRVSRMAFCVADGRTVECDTSLAIFKLNGASSGVPVVFAEPGGGHLLGATALESLGYGVDPVQLRLVPQALLAM